MNFIVKSTSALAVFVIAFDVLAHVLTAAMPYMVGLFVMAIIGRIVIYYTRY